MRIREKINNEMELLEREIKNCQLQLDLKSRLLTAIQRLVPLHSVGAFIDPVTGFVRNMLTNGDPEMDADMATHINDIDEEWLSSLNETDNMAVVVVKISFK